MALPPTPAPVTDGAPQPDPGVDAPDAGGGGWMPAFTIMKNADTGEFALVTGDEPEDMQPGADPDGPKFPDGPALLRGLMAQIEGGQDDATKAGFAEGFDKGSAGNDMRPGMDMPRGG